MDWLSRWKQGKIGWHEVNGNAGLRKFWPRPSAGCHVLVPLCGKSPDLLWLAEQGCQVTGVELSQIAARAFFEESGIPFDLRQAGGQTRFSGKDRAITIVCADYFRFSEGPFDALYDRASLVALPHGLRPRYAEHTKTLLKADATVLLVTLEYDQSLAGGPPYSVPAGEVRQYWPDLEKVSVSGDTQNIPHKLRQAGVTQLDEIVWLYEHGFTFSPQPS